MPELDDRLARARTDLLDGIDQPPLEQLTGRAGALRHRRHVTGAGAALVAVVAVAVLLVRPWAGSPAAEVPPAGATTPAGPVYADLGITINGLVREAPDLPGAIVDVEFIDSDHGYLITDERAFASTQDGGLTWQTHPLPGSARVTDLLLFPGGRLALPDGYLSDDGGQTWRVGSLQLSAVTTVGGNELLRLGSADALEVWSPDRGRRGQLTNGPPITVSWVADRPTADGIWWTGGVTRDGANRPALAHSADGGRTWTTERLDAPSGQARVSVLGRHAYAMVVGADRKLVAILHSADGGKTFTRTWTGDGPEPATLACDAVPLLDGRLLVTTTSQRWYVSTDDGATFTMADGGLPVVGSIHRTWAGYVAYDLFGPAPAGWAAFSSDGSTWRKLHVR
jgi:hypothetical protein